MTSIAKRSFSLPPEQAAYIDSQVQAGAYASASEVVRAGLRALQERDAAVEAWLRREVAETYDAALARPEQLLPAGAVLEALRRRHRDRLRGEG